MRDAHAADRHMIAGGEFVHVEPVARAEYLAGTQQLFGALEIFHGRDLEVSLGTRHQLDTQPLRFQKGRIVRELLVLEFPMRVQDRLEAKTLRRLRAPQAAAIDGANDDAVAAALQRIDHRHRRNCAGMVIQRRKDAVDNVSSHKGPRRVVDQHFVRLQFGEAFESVAHGFLPRRAAILPAAGSSSPQWIDGTDRRGPG